MVLAPLPRPTHGRSRARSVLDGGPSGGPRGARPAALRAEPVTGPDPELPRLLGHQQVGGGEKRPHPTVMAGQQGKRSLGRSEAIRRRRLERESTGGSW